jgi:SAM-dependent methyltransferase
VTSGELSAATAFLRRFEALAPWQTRFVVGGNQIGGHLDYSADERVPTFFEWFGAPRTILELASFEGAHTLQLAARETTERVVGLEGRRDNVERAQLVASVLGRGNVEFAVADLETVELTDYGRFDAVFCCGLLYHLVRPWRLLTDIARVSDQLFLDTHVWVQPETVASEGHLGGWYEEGSGRDPLSGLSPRSFWLTRGALVDALSEAGWSVGRTRDRPEHPNGPRVWLECRGNRNG